MAGVAVGCNQLVLVVAVLTPRAGEGPESLLLQVMVQGLVQGWLGTPLEMQATLLEMLVMPLVIALRTPAMLLGILVMLLGTLGMLLGIWVMPLGTMEACPAMMAVMLLETVQGMLGMLLGTLAMVSPKGLCLAKQLGMPLAESLLVRVKTQELRLQRQNHFQVLKTALQCVIITGSNLAVLPSNLQQG